MMETSIIPTLRDTLFNPVSENMVNSLIEIAEMGLDAVLKDGVIKDFPVLGTIASLCSTGINLRERNLLRQTAVFIKSFNEKTIERDKLDAYRYALESDLKIAEKELGRVVLLLDRIIEEKQSCILGHFYNAYVNGSLSWEKFVELSEANSRMFVSDFEELNSINRRPIKLDEELSNRRLYRIQRLESLGLVMENRTRLLGGSTVVYSDTDDRFIVSPLGGTFVSLMK